MSNVKFGHLKAQETNWREQMEKAEVQSWRNPSPIPRHRPHLFATLGRILLASLVAFGLFALWVLA